MKTSKQQTPQQVPLNREQRRRRAIRVPQVLEIYPVSEAQLWEEVARGDFPKPFKLTPGPKSRAKAWWDDEVHELVESRAAASRGEDQ